LERLSKSRPDLVLLDLNLPVVSGQEILEIIRKSKNLTHTKVVVITAHAHVANGLSAQPDLVLLKPVSNEQLTDLANRLTLSQRSPKAIPLQQSPLDIRTNLYNRSFFIHRLESTLHQSREIDSYLFSVLLFSVVPNNNLSNEPVHNLWESVLREVAGALRSILRPTDTLARFDPDTFYILIENVPDGETAVRIANRIQEIVYRKIPDLGKKLKVPIQVGILVGDRDYESVDMILNDAKNALSLAFAQGYDHARDYYKLSVKKPTTGT
jgi:diguanylate cyclase (GGDEF)-like protein